VNKLTFLGDFIMKLLIALAILFSTTITCFAGVTATVAETGFDKLNKQWFYKVDYRTGSEEGATFITREVLYLDDIDTTTTLIQKERIQRRCLYLDTDSGKVTALGIVVGTKIDKNGVVQP
jgi:hypothetical protein